MCSVNMHQKVNEPTRITNRSRTLIDLVSSNIDSIVVQTEPFLKISDHETISIKINENEKNMDKKSIISWKNYSP